MGSGGAPGTSVSLDQLADVPRAESIIDWGVSGLGHLLRITQASAPELDCRVTFWLGYRDRPIRNPPEVVHIRRLMRQWPRHAPTLWVVGHRVRDHQLERNGYFERVTVALRDAEELHLPVGWQATLANERSAQGAVWDRWLNIAAG